MGVAVIMKAPKETIIILTMTISIKKWATDKETSKNTHIARSVVGKLRGLEENSD